MRTCTRRGMRRLAFAATLTLVGAAAGAQTNQGEIEGRAAPVARRACVGGASAGTLCNADADCPGSTCRDRNVFTLSVAVHYDAPAADVTAIRNLVTAASATVFDVTDGQAEIGQAIIHNNAPGTTPADLRVYPATCTSGANVGAACATSANCPGTAPGTNGDCGIWWWANTGSWKRNGSMHVSINYINAAANPGPILGHEFVHLVFDARDEYETRPGCGNNTANASCPDAVAIAAGQGACLMDANGTELCWGQGNAANLTDMTNGNHDATNVTEQSQCRSNRSCWQQVAWSWPNTFTVPAGAPDAAANGAVVNPTNFAVTDDSVRVVLVLDESGSMALESPTRMERLRVAANDFVTLADPSAQVGLVSFASNASTASGRARVAIAALNTNRTTLTNAVNALQPSTRTNIGDGLREARALINAAPAATGSTYVVLMTDGLNNEPGSQASAAADLQNEITNLLNAGIPVYVTCTGGDAGLESQCAEIAAGTNGFYADAADSGALQEAFIDIHERIAGRQIVKSFEGHLSKVEGVSPAEIWMDPGSASALFVVTWRDPSASARLLVEGPDGQRYESEAMPQGRFVRVPRPRSGRWKAVVTAGSSQDSAFVLRAYTRNPQNGLLAAARHPTVAPGEEMYVYAYPQGPGGSLTRPDATLRAIVVRPDGTRDTLDLHDRGRDATGKGDDIAGDGTFTGVYRNTSLKGGYSFVVSADMENWLPGHDAHEVDPNPRNVRIVRETSVSSAVAVRGEAVGKPEDDRPAPGATPECCRRLVWLTTLVILLQILTLLLIWRCCVARRIAG